MVPSMANRRAARILMKLATLHDGSRDGQLVVVARDLATAQHASAIATRMQQLLDDWNFLSPQLEDVYAALNAGKARHAFPFDPRQCMAPLPRAFCWARACDAAGDAPVASGPPTLHLRRGDALLGPHEDAVDIDVGEASAHACAAVLAAVGGDLPRAAAPAQALEAVRLLMLALEWTAPAPSTQAAGAPEPEDTARATAFAPVAVTPDELGAAWRGGRVHLPLRLHCDGAAAATVDAAAAMSHDFGALLAALARTQGLRAGAIVGSRALLAALAPARAKTAPMAPDAPLRPAGVRARLEMRADDEGGIGRSVFGAVEQGLAVSDGAAHS